MWSGPKVARWIGEKIGRDHIHPHRGWVYLKRLGMSRQAPRARHERAASPEDQAAFKKTPSCGGPSPGGQPARHGRGLGLRRAPPRPEADHAPRLGAEGPAPTRSSSWCSTTPAGTSRLARPGWHVTEEIKPPEGPILLFLPPYTPELQPAERLWPLANVYPAPYSQKIQ